MRDYGKVPSTFWSDPVTATLSDAGKILALYLMTCSHGTIAGVFRLPDGYIAEDLRWGSETVREVFAELLAKGFAKRCETTKWVWIVKHLEDNPTENPNQRKAAVKVANSVPVECGWRLEFMRVSGPNLGIEPPPDDELFGNPSETVSKPVTVAVAVAVAGTEAVAGTGVDAAAAAPTPPSPPAPPAPPPAAPPPPPPPPAERGSRLSKEWVLPKQWGEWALSEFPTWNADVVRTEAAKFGDFWKAKTGKDATKLDWLATWRNWCRNARPVVAPRVPGGGLTDEARDSANAATTAEARRRYQQSRAGGEVVDAQVTELEPPLLQGANE